MLSLVWTRFLIEDRISNEIVSLQEDVSRMTKLYSEQHSELKALESKNENLDALISHLKVKDELESTLYLAPPRPTLEPTSIPVLSPLVASHISLLSSSLSIFTSSSFQIRRCRRCGLPYSPLPSASKAVGSC